MPLKQGIIKAFFYADPSGETLLDKEKIGICNFKLRIQRNRALIGTVQRSIDEYTKRLNHLADSFSPLHAGLPIYHLQGIVHKVRVDAALQG